MTLLLLADVEQFPETVYRAACRKAIDINDPEKASFLLEQAQSHVPNLSPSFHGEMASYAHTDHRFIAKQIIQQCTNEQITAAPPCLLEQFAMDEDYQTLDTLVEKGISGKGSAARTLHMLTYGHRNSWMAEHLLQKRMWVGSDDHSALHACVENDAVQVCRLLLDGGINFDQYLQWAENRKSSGHEETLQALADYWSEIQAEMEQSPAPETGGITFG